MRARRPAAAACSAEVAAMSQLPTLIENVLKRVQIYCFMLLLLALLGLLL
jgi:hypothetical protein